MEEPVPAAEQGVRAALTGLALYSVGDASSAVTFQRALQLNAPAAPTQVLIGAARAMQGRDPDAIAAWQAAIDGGLRSSIVAPFLIDAYLRRGDGARAAALVAAELGGRAPEGAWIRAAAATAIATGKDREAIALLDARLTQQPDDAEAQWLLLHALYGSIVRGGEKGNARDGSSRRPRTIADRTRRCGGVAQGVPARNSYFFRGFNGGGAGGFPSVLSE